MAEVNPRDLKLISKAEQVRSLYEGAGGDSRAGLEIELSFFDPAKPGLPVMSVAQNKKIRDSGNEEAGKIWIHNEPSSDFLEITSTAGGPDDLQKTLDDANAKIRALTDLAAKEGLKRSYFQQLPDKTSADLLASLVDVPRYQTFFGPPRADMRDIAAYFTVSKSNQVSVSYRNPDHMLENIRRLYFLSPFLFLLTSNESGFDEGKAFTGHAGMRHRASLKDRGLYPPYLFTARSGDEYIDAHIEHVFTNPLWTYYDEEGAMVRIPSGTWTSLRELEQRGLNTATNYFFSQTVLWPDVKIAALKDAQGEVSGHRFEARMFGVGIHQHQSAYLITAGLAFNPDFAEKTDALLREFGFAFENADLRQHLEAAYKNARENKNRVFEIPYGTGNMKDFAKKFADLLEGAYAGSGFEEALGPVLAIARSGCTDAKINRLLFDTLDKAAAFQRDADPAIFENPNRAAFQIFEKELREAGHACKKSAA